MTSHAETNGQMKTKLISAYMEAAHIFARLSTAQRLKVGAIVVKEDRIISIGYNGMPSGWDNVCENHYTMIDNDGNRFIETKSKPEVLHAETNAITKLARSSESGEGASIFITHSPCLDCAKMLYQSGITEVYYRKAYRSQDGVEFLKKCGITVTKT